MKLGKLSKLHESGKSKNKTSVDRAATISPGKVGKNDEDLGGKSYGTYQLSSTKGTVAEFLKWSGYDRKFNGLTICSLDFDNQWILLAKTERNFRKAQHKFIVDKFFKPVASHMDSLAIKRTPAIDEAIFSMAVQHGPSGAKELIGRAHNHFKSTNPNPTQEAIIRTFYNERKKSIAQSTNYKPDSKQIFFDRYLKENKEAIEIAKRKPTYSDNSVFLTLPPHKPGNNGTIIITNEMGKPRIKLTTENPWIVAAGTAYYFLSWYMLSDIHKARYALRDAIGKYQSAAKDERGIIDFLKGKTKQACLKEAKKDIKVAIRKLKRLTANDLDLKVTLKALVWAVHDKPDLIKQWPNNETTIVELYKKTLPRPTASGAASTYALVLPVVTRSVGSTSRTSTEVTTPNFYAKTLSPTNALGSNSKTNAGLARKLNNLAFAASKGNESTGWRSWITKKTIAAGATLLLVSGLGYFFSRNNTKPDNNQSHIKAVPASNNSRCSIQ